MSVIKTYFYSAKEEKVYHDIDLGRKEEYLADINNLLWIDLYEVNHKELQSIADVFDFHPLAIEDCLQESPRAKVDRYDGYYFFVFHAIKYDEQSEKEVTTLELNVFMGPNYVVTIHQPRIASIGQAASISLKSPEVLNKGVDYLLYYIVDGITDEYFPITSRISVRIEELEEDIYEYQSDDITDEFLALKRSIILIRRVILPQRRIFSNINGRWMFPIREENIPYFVDLIDHLDRIADATETSKDLVNGALETYYSIVSAKTSEIMRVLTIITTIMMPLTFITGFFGMNVPLPFHNSPWITLVILLAMCGLTAWMLYVFKKQKWM